jgi:molybdopterin-guanine dinucleotide biosynthesis protein A
MSPTGIILAGGKSSRLGQDKGLVELGGKKLIEIAIANLSLVCDRVLISSNSDIYNQFGIEVVPDRIPDIGPMGGLYSTMMLSRSDVNLVLSVDLPFVTQDLLKFLIDEVQDVQAAVPWSGDEHFEPLCACYNRSILPFMKEFIDQKNYKLPDLFKIIKLKPLIISDLLPFYKPNLFHNINTLSDLASAENMLNSIK